MSDNEKKLTRENSVPVANHQDVATAGPRGPMVLQDAWFPNQDKALNGRLLSWNQILSKL